MISEELLSQLLLWQGALEVGWEINGPKRRVMGWGSRKMQVMTDYATFHFISLFVIPIIMSLI